MMETPKTAALYVRVSTREQALEGYSIGSQTEKLKAYCRARGWNISNIYTDAGFSGGKLERPDIQRLIKDANNKRFDLVLVKKLDRLSRSQKDTLYLVEDVFLKNQIDFVSLEENFDTTSAFGRAMIGILSVFAQLERDMIKERTSDGRLERAKQGYFHGGGYAPIGYDYVDGELVIDEYEAMQIKEIYQLFLEKKMSITKIRSYMATHYKNKAGSWHSSSSIYSCLTSPIYIGKIHYLGKLYNGRHQAIISEDMFEQVQKRLADPDRYTGTRKEPFKHTTFLGGMLYCKKCGARYFVKGNYSGHGDKKIYRPYYTCYSRGKTRKDKIIDPNCKNKSWPVIVLDKVIEDELKKLYLDNSYFDHIVTSNCDIASIQAKKEIIKNQLIEIDKKKNRILDLYELGSIDIDKLNERAIALNEEISSLHNELNVLEEIDTSDRIDFAREQIHNLKTIMEHGELDEKRDIMRTLINKIEIDDESIDIHWSFI